MAKEQVCYSWKVMSILCDGDTKCMLMPYVFV
jgi:hypothetical protein